MSYLRNGSTDAVTTRSYRRVRSSRLRDNADSDQIMSTESSYGRKSYDTHGGSGVTSSIEYSRQVKTETKISGLGGPTQKSSLVQSMTANFERAKTQPQSLNGNDRKSTSNNNNNNAVSNSSATAKVSDDNEEDRNEPATKSAAASRRGRLQREKRMLRQKRRSTGVVSLQDLEDGKNANDESKEDKDLQRETEINTQQNEFTAAKSSTATTSSPSRTSKANEAAAEAAARTVTDMSSSSASSTSSVKQQQHRSSSGSNNVEDKHNDVSSISSKFRQRSSYDDFRPNTALSTTTNPSPYCNKNLLSSKKNEDKALAEQKEKLFLSEATVTRLKDAMHNMEQDLRKLEDDNGKLRRKNKLLEDENMTMLRLIRARDFE